MSRVDEIRAKISRRDRACELVMKHNGEDALTDLYRDSNADIAFLLAETDRQTEALKKARERCWSLCSYDEVHGRVLEHAAECNSCGITRAEYERILYPHREGEVAK